MLKSHCVAKQLTTKFLVSFILKKKGHVVHSILSYFYYTGAYYRGWIIWILMLLSHDGRYFISFVLFGRKHHTIIARILLIVKIVGYSVVFCFIEKLFFVYKNEIFSGKTSKCLSLLILSCLVFDIDIFIRL